MTPYTKEDDFIKYSTQSDGKTLWWTDAYKKIINGHVKMCMYLSSYEVTTYMILHVYNTTIAFYQQVPAIKSSISPGLQLTWTNFGFFLGVPDIGSILHKYPLMP